VQPGALVAGKYRIEHQLGRGGMGVVLAATHVHLGTRVALKFLNEGFSDDPKVIQRFLREARATASLKSEHVCKCPTTAPRATSRTS
jgi:serine/threonine-protein kinase